MLAVGRAERLSAASVLLNLDQSTVARRIDALEHAIETRLIERSPRGVRLTPAGLELFRFAETVEAGAAEFHAQHSGGDSTPAGVVRLATPEALGVWLVAPALEGLRREYPALRVDLLPEFREFNLSTGEADIVVTLAQPEHGRLFVSKLCDHRLELFASDDYLRGQPPIRGKADLVDHRFVSYVDELLGWSEVAGLDDVVPSPVISFRSTSVAAQQEAVAAGLGIGLLHVFSARRDPRLRSVLSEEVFIQRPYWLSMHANQRNLSRVRVVADFLRNLVRDNRDLLSAPSPT